MESKPILFVTVIYQSKEESNIYNLPMRPNDVLANYVDLETSKYILTYTQNIYMNYLLTGTIDHKCSLN